LLYKYVADEALREKLAMLRDHIQRFAPEQDPFDLIAIVSQKFTRRPQGCPEASPVHISMWSKGA
jgi:hypothetical protein